MKKLLAGLLCLLYFTLPNFAQKDIFGGLFEKEEPVFHSSIVPTSDSGTVMMVYYFTHSKASSIEASVWIKDLGTNLLGNGVKKLIRGLRETGNRHQDTLLLEGLTNLHFYTVGLDYRNPNSITRKFTSKVIEEGYQYQYIARPTTTKEKVTQSQEEIIPPINFSEPIIQQDPCQDPRISVLYAQNGYCGDANRPAIQVQCMNCEQKNWQFSVELRTAYGTWQPLRLDGRPQSAYGNSIRTEPLCTLQPETYYARVLAWGEQCSAPIISNLSAPIIIPGEQNNVANLPPVPPVMTDRGPAIPDTCVVYANAKLVGNIVRGTVELPADSPCKSFEPYAKLRYLHPGYRDLNIDNLPLFAGSIVPFEITLDARDLARGIHPVQVAVFVDVDNRSIPVGSFWIKAETDPVPIVPSDEPVVLQPIKDPYAQSSNGDIMASRGGTQDVYYDESLIGDSIDTISVKASDPNCTQIQDLQLVYDPAVPNQPLYISWLSPRCCQEEGCGYSVWTGKPGQLKLLVSGSKSGAVIRELLPQLQRNEDYFEVVVKTSNGTRKAAYVLGEGPKYGFEEILAYQDRFNPPKSDEVVFSKGSPLEPVTTVSYEKPQRPISDFKPCRIRRTFDLEGDQPASPGDQVKIGYDFSAKGYQYTLYHQPTGGTEWVVAPGTKQLQSSPDFQLELESIHSGKYLILSYKPDKNWGCLSAPMDKAINLEIE